jgi:acetyl-CoA carboxylase carboxyltransferase component
MAQHEKSGRELLAEVEAARARLMDNARPAAMAKLAARGKLSARERVSRLTDPGTFDEMGALVAEEGDG